MYCLCDGVQRNLDTTCFLFRLIFVSVTPRVPAAAVYRVLQPYSMVFHFAMMPLMYAEMVRGILFCCHPHFCQYPRPLSPLTSLRVSSTLFMMTIDTCSGDVLQSMMYYRHSVMILKPGDFDDGMTSDIHYRMTHYILLTDAICDAGSHSRYVAICDEHSVTFCYHLMMTLPRIVQYELLFTTAVFDVIRYRWPSGVGMTPTWQIILPDAFDIDVRQWRLQRKVTRRHSGIHYSVVTIPLPDRWWCLRYLYTSLYIPCYRWLNTVPAICYSHHSADTTDADISCILWWPTLFILLFIAGTFAVTAMTVDTWPAVMIRWYHQLPIFRWWYRHDLMTLFNRVVMKWNGSILLFKQRRFAIDRVVANLHIHCVRHCRLCCRWFAVPQPDTMPLYSSAMITPVFCRLLMPYSVRRVKPLLLWPMPALPHFDDCSLTRDYLLTCFRHHTRYILFWWKRILSDHVR